MTKDCWIILGATSVIAEEFARIAASRGCDLLLAGRDQAQLQIMQQDLQIRYGIDCELIVIDFSKPDSRLEQRLKQAGRRYHLFIAQADMRTNSLLAAENLADFYQVNVVTTAQLIHRYLQIQQPYYRLVYLSSMAACRGRSKNSLYGGAKSAIERYLEGLQQTASKDLSLTIMRLGPIDTKHCYQQKGLFPLGQPKACAQACWQAVMGQKRSAYFPRYWQWLNPVISNLPFFIFKRLGGF